jgi:ATP-binding cassette subfamily B protein/subfamily B ATP-binding cassette protein MsbA
MTGGLLLWVIALGLVIFLLSSATDVFLTFAWTRIGQKMVYRLAGDLFAHLQRRSLVFHSRNSVGDSMSRITGDSWCVYKLIDAILFTPGQALLMLSCMLVLMLRMDVGLTLLSLTVAPVMAGSSFLLGRPLRAIARLRRDIDGRIHAHVHQTLAGIPVVQVFNQEHREQERFEEHATESIRAQGRNVFISSVGSLATGMLPTLGTAAVLWLGGQRVLQGRVSVGELLVFLAYLRAMHLSIGKLTSTYAAVQEIRANVDRIFDVLDCEQEVRDRPGAKVMRRATGHLTFDRVVFGYVPDRAVLCGVSLDVPAGQAVAIVGGTGAGKSTLAGLVPRLFDAWSGAIRLDDHDVRDLTLSSLRANVALVLQEPYLFPTTIAENIAYGRPGATSQEIETAARAAAAHDFIVRLPQGYQTVIGERGATLSGGERQRLSIARALLKDAPVLIMDEPTSNLDVETEGQVLGALRRLKRGRTTLMIAHRLSTVRDADRIVVLEQGRVIEQGTHKQLIQQAGHYAKLHRLQVGVTRDVVAVAG